MGDEKTKYFFQFPSCESLIDRRSFDQVHHQHLNFFSINSISKILNKLDYNVKSYKICEHHYGSMMINFQYKNSDDKMSNLKIIPEKQSLKNIYGDYQIYIKNLIKIIEKYKKRDTKVYGVGASLMLPLVNYHLKGILNNIDGILDDDKKKINKFFPKINSKILSLKKTNLEDSVAIICSTASSITTRKLVEICKLKKAKLILVPSLSF